MEKYSPGQTVITTKSIHPENIGKLMVLVRKIEPELAELVKTTSNMEVDDLGDCWEVTPLDKFTLFEHQSKSEITIDPESHSKGRTTVYIFSHYFKAV
ncbi:hypothetical protein NRE35_004236 [Salmonella enterica]|nr:hypothetical protein [Salmonella enterica]